MTPAGWIFLVLAWGGVCSLVAFCLVRLLRGAPLDEATRDPTRDPDPRRRPSPP